jgi:hypothetical protein
VPSLGWLWRKAWGHTDLTAAGIMRVPGTRQWGDCGLRSHPPVQCCRNVANLELAGQAACEAIQEYEQAFGVPYTLPKLDLVSNCHLPTLMPADAVPICSLFASWLSLRVGAVYCCCAGHAPR